MEDYLEGHAALLDDEEEKKEDEVPKPTSSEFTLPDNKKITINVSDMTRAPEILFKPELVGLDHPGVH